MIDYMYFLHRNKIDMRSILHVGSTYYEALTIAVRHEDPSIYPLMDAGGYCRTPPGVNPILCRLLYARNSMLLEYAIKWGVCRVTDHRVDPANISSIRSCIYYCWVEGVRILVEYGASKDSIDGISYVESAIFKQDKEMVRALIDMEFPVPRGYHKQVLDFLE